MPGFGMLKLAGGLLGRFWYLVPIIGLAVALFVTRATLGNVKEERESLRAFRTLVVDTTREAAGNPKLSPKEVPAQIAALGRSLGRLSQGLERCNASARGAAERDAEAQKRAQEALRLARERDASRQAVIDRLRASAAQRPSAGAPGGDCEASTTLKELWK